MGFSSYAKIGKDINIENDLERIMEALALAQSLMDNARIAPSKVTPIFCCKTERGQLLKIFFLGLHYSEKGRTAYNRF